MDLKELKEILQILEEKEIAEFELEEQGLKLRIRKAAAPASAHAAMRLVPAGLPAGALAGAAPAAGAAAPPAPTLAGEVVEGEPGLTVVKSPMVGTFFRAPDPNAASFVNVGDRVRVGQVLCIIEAMKLMNELEAEVAGEIVKVHPQNGQPVQYGEPLFTIRTER